MQGPKEVVSQILGPPSRGPEQGEQARRFRQPCGRQVGGKKVKGPPFGSPFSPHLPHWCRARHLLQVALAGFAPCWYFTALSVAA